MIIKKKIGNLASFDDGGRGIDRLQLEWFETSRRILHKTTSNGREIILKFLDKAPNFKQDDVLFADDHVLIVVEIAACDAIVIRPRTNQEMAWVCYEIGNKHLPLFFNEYELLIPFDEPTFKMLQASGLEVIKQKRKLLDQLKTTVSPHHAHSSNGESLFSRIMKLTSSSPNE
jgi:urease accessory protein